MSNSLLTDGWALPVSIWDRALALIPSRLAISRSPIPWPSRSARSRLPRSRAGAAVASGRPAPPSGMDVMSAVYPASLLFTVTGQALCSGPTRVASARRTTMTDRLLLRGGTVLTIDPDLGDLPQGDVLIEGDRIAPGAPQIGAD